MSAFRPGYGCNTALLKVIEDWKKVGTYCAWQNIYKGFPQRSILGPVLFNVFLNDIFYFVKENKLYNYADDNTLSHSGPELNGLVKSLEKESAILIDWFTNNKMKANPDKFQAIAIGNK